MSLPRLLNSRMLELRRQLVASSSSSNTTRDPPPLHLSRNLFGTVDLQHNLKFAQQEMDKIHQADSKRWNFDFLAEKPKDGDYKWQKTVNYEGEEDNYCRHYGENELEAEEDKFQQGILQRPGCNEPLRPLQRTGDVTDSSSQSDIKANIKTPFEPTNSKEPYSCLE
ncbi:uncharacterized protein LOC121877950 [Homarus americanus]|uniref:uncharacterized protein LOC121877950 n=1 Tax=Homarus americanus TaxID=6706 RepID=UPI001C44AFA6|nr:uncharacterized protein LOC121877950 [Homarus americanus]